MKKIQSTSLNGAKVNIITMHLAGHARHSGYDRLVDYLDGNRIEGPERFSHVQKIVSKTLRPIIRRSGSLWYQRRSLIAELKCAVRWFTNSGEVFHFLYGENSYRYLGLLKRFGKKNTIVCTYHTPPDKFSKVVSKPAHLKSVDAIIVMSTMQIPSFAKFVGEERVFFVPHGVDVEHFSPNYPTSDEEKAVECLFVGSHLRDFETFAKAANMLSSRDIKLHFNIITPTSNHHYFNGMSNVTLMSRLSDDELLQAYQKADLFVLPLEESTANNVLLEAMACGLPIIATDLQGVRDYVNPDCAMLVPKSDALALADAVNRLSENSDLRDTMRTASRNRAIEFRWENIAKTVTKIYQEVKPV